MGCQPPVSPSSRNAVRQASSGMLLLFVFVKPIVPLQQFQNSFVRVISDTVRDNVQSDDHYC